MLEMGTLIEELLAVGGTAVARNLVRNVLNGKLVVVCDLFVGPDVIEGVDDDLGRAFEEDNLCGAVGLAAVVHEPADGARVRCVDDSDRTQTEEIAAANTLLGVLLFAAVCDDWPDQVADVLDDHLVGGNVFEREETPPVDLRRREPQLLAARLQLVVLGQLDAVPLLRDRPVTPLLGPDSATLFASLQALAQVLTLLVSAKVPDLVFALLFRSQVAERFRPSTARRVAKIGQKRVLVRLHVCRPQHGWQPLEESRAIADRVGCEDILEVLVVQACHGSPDESLVPGRHLERIGWHHARHRRRAGGQHHGYHEGLRGSRGSLVLVGIAAHGHGGAAASTALAAATGFLASRSSLGFLLLALVGNRFRTARGLWLPGAMLADRVDRQAVGHVRRRTGLGGGVGDAAVLVWGGVAFLLLSRALLLILSSALFRDAFLSHLVVLLLSLGDRRHARRRCTSRRVCRA
eukprot:m.255721 g.255721  ORF g.255721 m.255721 type:complete len:463 (-) comp19679_c0_seq1:1533-2921(-)